MKTSCFAVGVILALALPTGASAVVGRDENGVAPVMEEVVVTATKTQEKRKDIANSVIILDENDIAESPAKSVGELVANEPGVDWRTRGNYGGSSGEIHIRGMGAEGTQVVVNGVVINSPSLGSADVSSIPMNNIEKIEIVKGPGSLLYGSGAMGGTVNIITKSPKKDKKATKASVGYGTRNTYQIAAENGMFVAGDFGYYLTFNRLETDGFRDNSDLEHNDASLKLVLDKGDKLNVSLYGDYIDREYGLPGPVPTTGATSSFGVFNSESNVVDHNADENSKYVLQVKSKPADWLNLAMKSDYSVLESNNYSRYSSTGTGAETLVKNTVSGIEANAGLTPFSWAGLLIGSEYRNYDYENEQQSLDSTGAASGMLSAEDHDVFTNGTFVELRLRPMDYLKLSSGFRYEKHSTFGHETISRFGLVVNPFENTAIKMNRGKHFNAPTMNDLFWPDDGYTKGNENLKPETGWHTDFTVEQSALDNKFFASISYFKWDIKDKINWAEDSDAPALWGNYWTPSNIDSYQATGWEMNTRIGPFYSLSLDLSMTLLDALEERSPNATRPALYDPEKQFKGSIVYFTDFGLTSTVTARYVGDRPGYYASNTATTPQDTLDSYWTADVKIDQLLADHWRITLTASNLFDTAYDTFYASFYEEDYSRSSQPYPGAGRSVFVNVGAEF